MKRDWTEARRKVEADPQNPSIIKTVYGAGYLFLAAVTWKRAGE